MFVNEPALNTESSTNSALQHFSVLPVGEVSLTESIVDRVRNCLHKKQLPRRQQENSWASMQKMSEFGLVYRNWKSQFAPTCPNSALTTDNGVSQQFSKIWLARKFWRAIQRIYHCSLWVPETSMKVQRSRSITL